MNQPEFSLPYPEQIAKVLSVIPDGLPIHLVGGTVRDILLSRPIHDLDFVLSHNALEIGRKVADILDAAYYPLDPERGTARIILRTPANHNLVIDFASYQGNNLRSDLLARDFTINSMAIPARPPYVLVDPLSGQKDLISKVIRASSNQSFINDPLRTLRCVRQAVDLKFNILPETISLLKNALKYLLTVSSERIRDEIFRMLEGSNPRTALEILSHLGVINEIFPELISLKGVSQTYPHHDDAWNHTLNVVGKLNDIFNLLSVHPESEKAENWTFGMLSLKLGRYRQALHEHFIDSPNPDRLLRSLLLLAALYHDAGKSKTGQTEENGRIRFFDHERISTQLIRHRAHILHLSNPEIDRLGIIVLNHMRPFWLTQNEQPPTRRAIYRFFRECGPAGLDVCLLSLADALGTYGAELTQEVWTRLLDTVRILLEAWWEHPEESISPQPLISGHDLITQFGIKPGPQIGNLLERILESQAVGEIQTREEAFIFIQTCLDESI